MNEEWIDMKKPFEKHETDIYAIVQDNHGDIQKIPVPNGQFIIFGGYRVITFKQTTIDPKCVKTISIGKSEDI